jgi:hypothetical protein
MAKMNKPEVSGLAQMQLDKAEKQFDEFQQGIKDLTLDRLNEAPKQETEMQTKLSSKEIANSKDIVLKPNKTISCRNKFNENFRQSYEFDKQLVNFIAENKEIIGEKIEIWTKPYAGVPAEFWEVPPNKPVWGPRYLAEQIKSRTYHKLVMTQAGTGGDGMGQYFGTMAADQIIQRLDAHPVSKRKSVFMGFDS